MSIDSFGPSSVVSPTDLRGQAPDRGETVRLLAQQFESLLLSQMLRDMQPDPAQSDSGSFGGPLKDSVYGELANALVRAGGIGLATSLEDAMARTTPGGDPAGAIAAGASILRPHSPWLPTGPVSMALDPEKVTSAYGVRRDPISGANRMHHGVDIPMADGDDVRSLKSGTVIESGNRGGYGQTVVVDHGDGLTTRYAHLSARHVQIGDQIAGGQVLGLAGQTGRATGPHLHLEVRSHGVTIDPLGPDANWLLRNLSAGTEKNPFPADDDSDGVSR